jgi:hypothetical protein
VPRFDCYRNPNARASHEHWLDVQSDLVRTATRWCVPLMRLSAPSAQAMPLLEGAHLELQLDGERWLLDAPNILAVPARLLSNPVASLPMAQRPAVEGALDFMLRGW